MRMKVTVTFKWEYEANPANYPQDFTPQQIADMDRIGIEEDPELHTQDHAPDVVVEPVNV